MNIGQMLQNGKPQDEWYTPTYAVYPLVPYLKPNSTILCPFDQEISAFVRVLHSVGHTIWYEHIKDGRDFFTITPDEVKHVDYVISNPPYSVKDKVYQHLFLLDRPFAMLVGGVGLFEGARHSMFSHREVEVMWLYPRVSYFNQEWDEIGSPPFQSVYVCSRVLPKPHIFTTMQKR